MGFPNTRVGCHFLFQGIFPTQESNPPLLCLLHWHADSWPLSHQGSPCLYIVAMENQCSKWTGSKKSVGERVFAFKQHFHVPAYLWDKLEEHFRAVRGLVSTSGDASQDSNESNEVAEGLDANWEHRAAGNWCLALLPRCPESEATVHCPSWEEGPSQAQCVAEDPGSASHACQLPSGASFCLLCPRPPSRHTDRYGPGLGSLPELISHLGLIPILPATLISPLSGACSALWGLLQFAEFLAPDHCPICWLLLWGPP